MVRPAPRPIPVHRDLYIIGQNADPTARAADAAWHDHVVVGGEVRLRRLTGVDLGAHGLHYGTNIISGIGAWLTHLAAAAARDPAWVIFRLRDHVRRALRNMRAIGFKGPLPSEEEVMNWIITAMGLGIPQLHKPDLELKNQRDVYGRVFGLADNIALGVSSPNRGVVNVLTRNLTEYVPESGLSLLFMGMLFRRPSMFMGLTMLKSESNYALAHVLKNVVAAWYKCDEVLAMSWDGSEISETSGSVPALFFYGPGDTVTVRIPRLGAYRLNGITVDTFVLIARQLGWKVIIDEPVTWQHVSTADEIWVLGSWSGMAPVTRIMVDPRFLPKWWQFTAGLREPKVPASVWHDSVDTQYFDWLEANFQPVDAGDVLGWRYAQTPGTQGSRAKEIYWRIVRQDPALTAEFNIPADWHTPVEPLVGVLEEA